MTTLLVTHGALGSAAQMLPVARALQLVANLNVKVIEFPGHGDSPLTGEQVFGLDLFVDTLHHAVSTCENDRPYLFGYSMGGYVGLALEAKVPGSFAGILTLGTKFDWNPESAEREASRLNPSVIEAKVPKFAEALAARHASAGGWKMLLSRTAAFMRDSGRAPVLTPQRLSTIASPVTVVVGDRDDVVTVGESERASQDLPNASLHVLPDVPHPIERVPIERVVSLVQQLVVTA